MKPEFLIEYINKTVEFDIRDSCRKDRNAWARYVFWKVMKTIDERITYEHLGWLCNRDHASAMHGVKRFDELYPQTEYIRMLYKLCMNFVGNGKKLDEIKNFEELLHKYNADVVNVRREYQEQIEEIKKNINILSPIIEQLKHLTKSDIDELIDLRIKPFIRMRKLQKVS